MGDWQTMRNALLTCGQYGMSVEDAVAWIDELRDAGKRAGEVARLEGERDGWKREYDRLVRERDAALVEALKLWMKQPFPEREQARSKRIWDRL